MVSRTPKKPTDPPTTGYPGLFSTCLKYSGFLTVHPAPKLSCRSAGGGVRRGALVRWDDIVLDICDKEKCILLRTASSRVFSVTV